MSSQRRLCTCTASRASACRARTGVMHLHVHKSLCVMDRPCGTVAPGAGERP